MYTSERNKEILTNEKPLPLFQSEILRVKQEIQPNNFNIHLITDMHYDTRETPRYKNASLTMNHLTSALEFDDAVDVTIVNGDNVDSMYQNLDDIKQDTKEMVAKCLDRDHKSDVFIHLGNHDDGSSRERTGKQPTLDNFIKEKEYEKIFRTAQCLNGETREGGSSLYYYKDYDSYKIRLIGLYTEDINENLTDSEGRLKYGRWLTHTIGQKQLDWIANTALRNVPEDYHVVIVGHCPPYYDWEDIWAKQVNHEFQIGLLKAFKEGTKYYQISKDKDFPLVADYDFSDQGERILVGFFAGHTHRELLTNWDGIPIVHCLHSVDMPENDNAGTLLEDAQTTISIDIKQRHVELLGFGRATNREFYY